MPLLRSHNLLEQLTELRETLTYVYRFIRQHVTKDTGGQSGREAQSGRRGDGAWSFRVLAGGHTALPPRCVSTDLEAPHTWCIGFDGGFIALV